MLVLVRKAGQVVTIAPQPALDPATPVGELFRNGPIEILTIDVDGIRVKLGFVADERLLILRDELSSPEA